MRYQNHSIAEHGRSSRVRMSMQRNPFPKRPSDVAALLLQPQPTPAPHVCAVAASFELNADWEFDVDAFLFSCEAIAR